MDTHQKNAHVCSEVALLTSLCCSLPSPGGQMASTTFICKVSFSVDAST